MKVEQLASEHPLSQIRVVLPPTKIAILWGGLALLALVAGVTAHIVRHQIIQLADHPLSDLLRRLDIVEEPSLWQWLSSIMHLTIALLASLIAVTVGSRARFQWFGLSFLFIASSIDEAIMLHELMDRPTRELLSTSGWLSISWIIPGSLVATVVAVLFAPLVRSLERQIAVRLVLAASVFLCGSILLEIPGGFIYERYQLRESYYILIYAFEELLEACGLIICIHALLSMLELQLNSHATTLNLCFGGTGLTPRRSASDV